MVALELGVVVSFFVPAARFSWPPLSAVTRAPGRSPCPSPSPSPATPAAIRGPPPEPGGRGRLPVDLHRPGLPGAVRRGARDRGPGRRRGVNELGNRLGCRRQGAPPPAGSRERAQADFASLRRQVRELRRRSALAAATAAQLGLELVVSYHLSLIHISEPT